MVFSPLHYIPSALAALLLIALIFTARKNIHRYLGVAMVLSGLLGLIGHLSTGYLRFFPLDIHAVHSWLGANALLLSMYVFSKAAFGKIGIRTHCHPGYFAALLAAASLLSGLILLSGQIVPAQEKSSQLTIQEPASSRLPEVEAAEYWSISLTPLDQQGNNAIEGTQYIGQAEYRLLVTGLVERQLNLSYKELLALPAYSEVAYMPCVEGWGFTAKWTGFRITDLLNISGLKPEARYAVFHTNEGYSTGLPLDYLKDSRILMAYGINDLTLPPERGFPFQLVAKDRYGYKWAKWIIGIEVTEQEVRGYWESRGYSNQARVGDYPFGP